MYENNEFIYELKWILIYEFYMNSYANKHNMAITADQGVPNMAIRVFEIQATT